MADGHRGCGWSLRFQQPQQHHPGTGVGPGKWGAGLATGARAERHPEGVAWICRSCGVKKKGGGGGEELTGRGRPHHQAYKSDWITVFLIFIYPFICLININANGGDVKFFMCIKKPINIHVHATHHATSTQPRPRFSLRHAFSRSAPKGLERS